MYPLHPRMDVDVGLPTLISPQSSAMFVIDQRPVLHRPTQILKGGTLSEGVGLKGVGEELTARSLNIACPTMILSLIITLTFCLTSSNLGAKHRRQQMLHTWADVERGRLTMIEITWLDTTR